MEHVKVPLMHGSLLTMEGALQHDWQVGYFIELLTLLLLRIFNENTIKITLLI